jgi:hypothetical protein
MELLPYPRTTWKQEYDELMKDKYLSKKYNRERRIKDLRKFMGSCTPELKHCTKKRVLELGVGMGEWLEICREFGHYPSGLDANPDDVCEMGTPYVKLAQLMAERQKLKVSFVGFKKWMKEEHSAEEYFYILSRGSIEQMFSDYMVGPPHWQTKDCSQLSWDIGERLTKAFHDFIFILEHILEDGGYIVIHANGAKNSPAYDNLMLTTLKEFPTLHLMKKVGKTFHKIQKRS